MATEHMSQQRRQPPRSDRRFEIEPSDEWNPAYGAGGPVRSDEPERDYFFENSAAPAPRGADEGQLVRRMTWRAAGAQNYPGGALEQLAEASHRGKGPKNYRPSDERLREIVCERLTDDPFIDATDVEVSVATGEVTLSGSVDSRQQKLALENLVASIFGVTAVQNTVEVRRER